MSSPAACLSRYARKRHRLYSHSDHVSAGGQRMMDYYSRYLYFHTSITSWRDDGLVGRLKSATQMVFGEVSSIAQGQLDKKLGAFAESLIDPALLTAVKSLQQLVNKLGIDTEGSISLPSKEATGTFLINLLLLKQQQQVLRREKEAACASGVYRYGATIADEKMKQLSETDKKAIKDAAYYAMFAEAAYGALGNISLLRERMKQKGFKVPPLGTSIEELERLYIVEHLKLRARGADAGAGRTSDGLETGSTDSTTTSTSVVGRLRANFLKNSQRDIASTLTPRLHHLDSHHHQQHQHQNSQLQHHQQHNGHHQHQQHHKKFVDADTAAAAVEVRTLQASSKTMEARAFFVAVDHMSKSVVVSVRGTFALADVIMAIMCDVEEWKQEWGVAEGVGVAHQGMADGAQAVWNAGAGAVAKALKDNPDYGLVLTGHSLGGSTAILLRMMLDAEEERQKAGIAPDTHIRCIAFAPAPVFGPSTATLKPEMEESITSFVNRNDIVPHLSLASVFRLVSALQRIDALPLALPQRAKYLLEFWLGKADEGQGKEMEWILKAIEHDSDAKNSPSSSSSSSSKLSSMKSALPSVVSLAKGFSFSSATNEVTRFLTSASPELDKLFGYLKKAPDGPTRGDRGGGGDDDGKPGLSLPTYDEVLLLVFQVLYGSKTRLASKDVEQLLRGALLGGGIALPVTEKPELAEAHIDTKHNNSDGENVSGADGGGKGVRVYSQTAPPDEIRIPGKVMVIQHGGVKSAKQLSSSSLSSSSSSSSATLKASRSSKKIKSKSAGSDSPLEYPRPGWLYAEVLEDAVKAVPQVDLADDSLGDHMMADYVGVLCWLRHRMDEIDTKTR